MIPYQVTRIVTFRLHCTQASPCSSVWQNGDAGLAALSELIADAAGAPFVPDARLQAVDTPGRRISGYHLLLEPLQLGGVLRGQGSPLCRGAAFRGEGP